MTYQGWTNYETWCADYWLKKHGKSDDYHEYKIFRALIERIHDDIYDVVPSLDGGPADDLLGAAISQINIREIAEHYLEQ